MSDNVAVELPGGRVRAAVQPCPHMKRITLPKILRSLETMAARGRDRPRVAERARRRVERMLAGRTS